MSRRSFQRGLKALAALALMALGVAYGYVATNHFSERELSRRPYPMRGIELEAPKSAEGIEYYGKVRLSIRIDQHGTVEGVEVASTTLPLAFAETAARAFASVQWEPGRLWGLRVRTVKIVEVDFQPPQRALEGTITPADR